MNFRLPARFVSFICATLAGAAAVQSAETVSLILIDGDIREDWPDPGSVAFHRTGTAGNLVVNFSVGGSAVAGVDFQGPTTTQVTIPDGDREAWVQFSPTGQVLTTAARDIIVTLQPGAGYELPSTITEQTTRLTLGNASANPGTKAAIRFLLQAGFGPNNDLKNVREVMTKGFDRWITDQFNRPVGLHQPYISYLNRARRGRFDPSAKTISWWNRAMEVPAQYPGGPARAGDPLRQRVGFALSEIFVISDRLDELWNQPLGMTNYYDMLLKGAFGNFRDLLYNVATHPCMGVYLNHLQNEKGDPEAGTFADENFAREIMQLFSIGLWELNMDGTRKLDGNDEPIPTYDNHTIAEMARVMTGFSFGGPKARGFWDYRENYTVPMRMWDEYHDLGAKTLLNGVTLPARQASDPDKGTAGMLDFNAAIDCLFNHPNTAPFISKQLIQKLVTSNPSTAYVGRVAAKFADNGSGIRGDMKAVIRAILMDPEARDPGTIGNPNSGKMKEPYLRTANLVRALGAKPANATYDLRYLDEIHFQEPQSAPSVFNFFKPEYAPDGAVSDAGLVAPEFQILNAVTALAGPNYYFGALHWGFNRWGSDNPRAVVKPALKTELSLINDVPALMRRLDLLLTGGTLPNEQHQLIREAVEQIDDSMWQWKQERVRMAIYLISTAPEFGILR